VSVDTTRVIRPAAIVPDAAARMVLSALEQLDVSQGGKWNVTPGLWQRFDKPWDGVAGGMGTAKLIGTIGVTYGTPTKYAVTIFRVTVTAHGADTGWTVESLCDDALRHADLTLERCPRADLHAAPVVDPFRRRALGF
jgi:hypothetical protein